MVGWKAPAFVNSLIGSLDSEVLTLIQITISLLIFFSH